MKTIFCSVLFVLCISALFVLPAFAATIHIPNDQPTIQAGIDTASDSDLILVSSGTYIENIEFHGKSIIVRSEQGQDFTVIEGNQIDPVVGFELTSMRVDKPPTIDGFTIRNGASGIIASGTGLNPIIKNCTITRNVHGGIFGHQTSLIIDNCIISHNGPNRNGGGIHFDGMDHTPIIMNSTISDNSTDGRGGGIYYTGAPAIIENCIISRNSSGDDGGGIFSDETTITITDSTITENTALSGGGIYFELSAELIINNCTISNNHALDMGGGIYFCFGSSSTIENCTFLNNRADHGGGIFCCTIAPSEITNSVFVLNSAESCGGGINCNVSDPLIRHCTFTANHASGGGGISCVHGNPTIMNCILWENFATVGPEIELQYTSSPEITFSDVQGGWPGEGNIDSDPLFFGIDNYHLTPYSPCIDAGTPVSVDGDIDGDARPWWPNGGAWDLGFDEYKDEDADRWASWEDCDDADPDVHPGRIEGKGMGNCGDGKDNDCDGFMDAADPDCGPQPCLATLVPISKAPIALYVILAFTLIFFARKFLAIRS